MRSTTLSFLESAPDLPGTSPVEYVELFRDATRPVADVRLDKRVQILTRADALDPRLEIARDSERREFLDGVRQDGVAVVGAGLMGTSIAAAFVNAEVPVVVHEPVDAAIECARERLERELKTLRGALEDAKPDPREENDFVRKLIDRFYRISNKLDDLADVPVVIESIPEKIKLKTKLYRALDEILERPVLLLTNTSSLRLSELGAALPREIDRRSVAKERFLGFHFFHPATRRAAVEIAFSDDSTGDAIAQATALARVIRKTPLHVADAQGFLVNRLLQAFLNESLALLDERLEPERLEALALAMGMESSPLRILDEIGLDVALRSGWSFLKAFPTRTHESKTLEALVREGRLGRKTRLGFYRYESSAPWRDDATLAFSSDDVPRGAVTRDARDDDDETLARRIAVTLFLEAARCVDEGVALSFHEADAALALALGFPRAKGGICYWAFASGLSPVLEEAARWRALGDRFAPPDSILRLAAYVP